MQNGSSELPPDGSSIKTSDYSNAVVWAVASPVSAGDETVKVTVNLGNNPAFEMIGMRVMYDAALKPVIGNVENGFAFEDGSVTEGMLAVTSLNEEEHIAGYAMMNVTPLTANGSLFSFEFTLPQDAQSGDSFILECDVADFLIGQSQIDVTSVTTSFTLN